MRVHEGRRRKAALIVLAATFVLAAACDPGPSGGGGGGGGGGGTQPNASAALGTPKRATGAPIKIGFVHDGKTTGIDHTPVIAAFNASVQYANEYLNGINGHVIEVDECSTDNTPAGATNCGVKLAQDKVAAVLVPVSAQDATVFNTLAEQSIPYFTYAAASQDIITKPGAFLEIDPVAGVAGPAKIAKDKGYAKAGIIIIDVPAATGPLKTLAEPVYQKAGVGLDVVAISPQVADMTPQVQEAMGSGAQLFSVIGTDEFNTSAINALKQLGFEGTIVIVTAPTPAMVENISGGLEGVVYITSATSDPSDPDVQTYNAVMATYAQGVTPSAQSPWAFANVVGFVKALTGDDAAVDASSVTEALKSMPKELPLPLGAGLTYRCGANVVPLLPNVCTLNTLVTTLNAEGQGQGYSILDVSTYIS